MKSWLGPLALSLSLLAGCSALGQSGGLPEEASSAEAANGSGSSSALILSRTEAMAEMVRLSCEDNFARFTALTPRPMACESFIFAVSPDAAVDPSPYQRAMEQGRIDLAADVVQNAWLVTWSSWLTGAGLVCEQTVGGSQSAAEREVTIAALEAMAPGFATKIYSQSIAILCPEVRLPKPDGLPDPTMTARGAVEALCGTSIAELPDLVDSQDSAYWTEVVQILAVAQGIRVGPIDGQYGPQTIAGVQQLQRLVGVVDDGQVGPITWTALQGYFC